MTTKKQSTDYIAMWFAARKEFGINDDMRVGPMDTTTREISWSTFPHSEMDGLGGLATILRSHGYPCEDLPVSSEKKPPSLIELLRLMWQAPKHSASKTIQWRQTYPDYATANPENSNDAPIATGYFSEDETNLIKRMAKKHRVALNVYLFWALNKAIAENLLAGQQEYFWFYPINLRGPLQLANDTMNYSSGINIQLNNTISPVEIQQRIKIQLKAKSYWLLWWQAHIGKIIGYRGVRWLYRYISERQFYAGSFSFLGNWPLKSPKNPPIDENQIWVTCGIGTKNYPVSNGILIWHNRLSLGLKLHPYICQDQSITDHCLQEWKRNLLKGAL
ncbi:hypothetical protein OLMES_3380 [Oleiphilus messinensis]|uniref:Uncharacterized protein n=1 Tax=Oleiphilus messinensis TaxID=141451 RepID=A0A1Y0IA79_9GAMM|nr:hypothetical protein [Oleiphilus messinensis]ARU57418.1 hypothetical protein OLMES_3380 [Oleiphilus messinensis]